MTLKICWMYSWWNSPLFLKWVFLNSGSRLHSGWETNMVDCKLTQNNWVPTRHQAQIEQTEDPCLLAIPEFIFFSLREKKKKSIIVFTLFWFLLGEKKKKDKSKNKTCSCVTNITIKVIKKRKKIYMYIRLIFCIKFSKCQIHFG